MMFSERGGQIKKKLNTDGRYFSTYGAVGAKVTVFHKTAFKNVILHVARDFATADEREKIVVSPSKLNPSNNGRMEEEGWIIIQLFQLTKP